VELPHIRPLPKLWQHAPYRPEAVNCKTLHRVYTRKSRHHQAQGTSRKIPTYHRHGVLPARSPHHSAKICQTSILTNITNATPLPSKPQPAIEAMAQPASSALRPQTATLLYRSSMLHFSGSTTTSETRSTSSYGLETPSVMTATSRFLEQRKRWCS